MVMTAFRKGSRARVRVTTPTTTVPTTMRAITETTRRCASSTTAGILGRRRASTTTTTTTTLADDLEAASTAFGCARGLDAELAEAMGNARARPFGTTTVMSMSMKTPSLGERVMVKAREEEEEEKEELASPLRADGGLESQILEMWLMAVPKRKVTPSRRKRRNQFKRLPFIESVVRCRMCGKVNRPHVHCCDVEERHDGGSSRGGDEGVSS